MKHKIETKSEAKPKRPDVPVARGSGGKPSPGRPPAVAALAEPEILDPEAEARRSKAADRARRWRIEQKRRFDPEAAERAEREAAEREAAEREAAEREAAERTAKLAELDAMVAGGLTGIIEAATTLIQRIWLDPSRPEFGVARSQIVAQAWAPIIRPHLDQYLGENPAVMLATLLTAGVVSTWIAEYQGATSQPAAV